MTVVLDRARDLAADRLAGVDDESTLARRDLLVACPTPTDLAARFDPRYVRTPALDLIGERLAQAIREHDGRLVLSIPPQEGKTSLLRWFCAWLLVDDPDRRVVYASYAATLARTSGRVARSYIQTFGSPLGLTLARDHADASDWQLSGHMGGVVTTGVGGALTGRPADCVSAETAIIAEHGTVTAAQLAAMPTLPKVLSWNHSSGRAEWRQVQASRAIPGREVVELRTAAGRTLRCTADHLVHVPSRGGYVRADQLRPGDRLVAARLGNRPLHVLLNDPQAAAVVPPGTGSRRTPVLHEAVRTPGLQGRPDLRSVRIRIPAAPGRRGEGEASRVRADVLLEGVPGSGGVGPVRGGARLRDLRQAPTLKGGPLVAVLLAGLSSTRSPADGRGQLRALREGVRAAAVRAGEEAQEGWASLLLQAVRVGRARQPRHDLQTLRNRHAPSEGPAVLLDGVSTEGREVPAAGVRPGRPSPPGDHLPDLRAGVPAEVVADEVLRPGLRGVGAQPPHDRSGELPLQGRHQLRRLVQEDATRDLRAGRQRLRGVQGVPATAGVLPVRRPARADADDGAPHQSRPAGQPAGEPDPALPGLPHATPQVGYDTVSVVRRVRDGRVTVYDFQVEGNRNFFAGEVLVHNCLIVDDPIRNRQDAESPTIRDNLHTWWTSVALTRLAPGAPTLVVQTRWHPDDLAGRMSAEGWPIVNIPALSDGKTPDALERPAGVWLPSARGRTDADWEKKRSDVGERDFASLYQGRPAPLEGGVFKAAWFDTWRVAEAPAGCLPPVVVVDPADNEGDGDEAGIIVGAQHPTTKKVYVLDDLSAAMTVARWARLALLTCVRREAPTLAFERSLSQLPARIADAWAGLHREATALRKTSGDVAAAVERLLRADDGPDVRAHLEQALSEIVGDVDGILVFGRTGPRLKAIVAKGSKQVRMQLIAPMFETGRAVMVGKHSQLEHVASVWQPGQDSPDRVDAMTHLCAYLGGTATVTSLGRAQDRVPTTSTSLRNGSSNRLTRSTRR